MSWDSYIDNLILQTKDDSGKVHADKVCIIGLDGGTAWTTGGHAKALKLTPAESAHIAKCMKSKDFATFQTGGVHAEGVKYQFLRADDGNLVFAKKKDYGGLTVQSTKQAVVIAHTVEGCSQGNTNKGIAAIAQYLESKDM